MSAGGPIVVVAGATATGKTETALRLAEELQGELIGADSVQVYRGFDIGSAKPTAEELRGIRHHLIDVVDPPEAIDAMRYAELADAAIAEVRGRDRLPIVVGGTGLWIRALLRGLVDLPPVDQELRAGLESRAEEEGAPTLHAELARIDPLAAEKIHPNDALRIVRALEVFAQTGTPLGELRRRHALGAPRYEALFCVVERPRDDLSRRIEARTDGMLARGWVEEVRSLLERFGPDVRAMGSVGYRELLQHVLHGVPLPETRDGVVSACRRYARHQRTWFRGEPGVSLRCAPGELTPERVRSALRE